MTVIQDAVDALRIGDTVNAYKLLAKHVAKNPKDAHAWYLLSFAVEKREHQIDCLERSLKILPVNAKAKTRLLQITESNQNNEMPSANGVTNKKNRTPDTDHERPIEPESNPTNKNFSKESLEEAIEDWQKNLSYREKKVIEYIYLGDNRFSVGSIGRIISEPKVNVEKIRSRAFEKLLHMFTDSSISPSIRNLVETVTINAGLNNSDLVSILSKNWFTGKYDLLGLIELIQELWQLNSKTSVSESRPPQLTVTTGRKTDIPVHNSNSSGIKNNINLKTVGETSAFSKSNETDKNKPIIPHSKQRSLSTNQNTKVSQSQFGTNCLSAKNEANKKERRPSKHIHNLWQISDSGVDYKKIDVFQFLIDDVSSLPIITNPHQELWLGIQLQATNRLYDILTYKKLRATYTPNSRAICQSLLTAWESLNRECIKQEFQSPRLEIWVSELLLARRNVYELRRSRLRRFIRNVQKAENERGIEKILDLVYQVTETLAIYSSNALDQLGKYIITHNSLPPVNEMETWLPSDEAMLRNQAEVRINQAQHILTTGYLRYAMRIAQGYVDRGVPYADLVQAGFWGLFKAAKKFDYRVQARFGSFATSWIWQAIGREIADQRKTIRLPVHIQEDLRKWESACERYEDGYHDPTRNHDILFHAGLLDQSDYDILRKGEPKNSNLPVEVLDNYERAVAKARKLCGISPQIFPWTKIQVINHLDVQSDVVESIEELLSDDLPPLDYTVDRPFIRQIIDEQVFSCLTEREQEILALRYGLADDEERTLEEVGKLFGLTRERIRQIESKALQTLNNRIKLGLLPDLSYLLRENELHFNQFQSLSEKIVLPAQEILDDSDVSNWDRLTDLLAQLPRSDWVEGRSGTPVGKRQEQLVSALEQLGMPAHVSDIAEQVNSADEGKDLSDNHVYSLLLRDEETFILLGQSVFSLVAWESARASESQPILACSPMPLPDPPDYEDAFFESVLVGKQAIARGLTAVQFVNYMLHWAKVEDEPQKWFVQTILSAYYLVDLIPYVFTFGGENPILECTLPNIPIQELRYHCLAKLSERLVAMPEFWWLLQQHQPARPTDLGEMFADVHPYGFDDTLQRLRLLASLGAAQKLKYGEYKLTPIGEECANRWKREAKLEIENEVSMDILDLENNFANYIEW